MRIKGVDDDYARLLARAGVAGIVDLSTRNPMELEGEVDIAAAIERLGKSTPREPMLANWVEQARLMLRHVWYHDTWGAPSLTGRPPKRYQGPRDLVRYESAFPSGGFAAWRAVSSPLAAAQQDSHQHLERPGPDHHRDEDDDGDRDARLQKKNWT